MKLQEESGDQTPTSSSTGMRRRGSIRSGSVSQFDFFKSPAGRRGSISSITSRASRRASKVEEVDLSKLPNASKCAGQALIAFLKIIGEVSRSKDILNLQKINSSPMPSVDTTCDYDMVYMLDGMSAYSLSIGY